MWKTLKSLDFGAFIDFITAIIKYLPPSFVIVVTAGLFILCALAVKRVLF